MRLETEAERRAAKRSKRRRARRARAALTMALASGAVVGGVTVLALLDWSRAPVLEPLASRVRGPVRFVVARASEPAPPTLVLDQKFKHIHPLHLRRERALEVGFHQGEGAHFSPAVATLGSHSSEVRVRLADAPRSAFAGDAWPLLVESESLRPPFGMQRFELRPVLDGSVSLAPLLLEHASDHGLPSARHAILTLVWNGQNLGPYSAVEAPSLGLVEASGRNPGAIVAWDDRADRRFRLAASEGADSAEPTPPAGFDDAFTAPLREVEGDADVAMGLLRGFLDGELEAGDVFDREDTAVFLALIELWNIPHAASFRELHLSYDPITARLSPIVHPGSLDTRPAMPALPANEASRATGLSARWVDDPEIRSRTQAARARLSAEIATTRRREFAQRSEDWLTQLYRASPTIRAPGANALRERALRLAHARSSLPTPDTGGMTAPARPLIARDHRGSTGGHIELAASGNSAVEVRTLGTGVGNEWAPVQLEEDRAFPLTLAPGPPNHPRRFVEVPYRIPTARAALPIRGVARMRPGTEESSEFEFVVSPGGRSLRSPVPNIPELSETLARNPFLRLIVDSSAARHVFIPGGSWDVRGDLALPRGVGLEIEAGTSLRFGPGRGILVQDAPLRIEGREDAPVRLEGRGSDASDRSWGGVAAIADSPIRWRHVVVRDAVGLATKRWASGAAVLIRAPSFEGEHLRLEDIGAPEALALDRCSAALVDLRVERARRDGIALRHSRLAGDRIRVREAGGRGLSQRGGRSSLRAAEFRAIGDAAVALEQRARLEGRDMRVERAVLGVVARDGAEVRLRGGAIEETRDAAILAFGASSGWGSSEVHAEGLSLRGPKERVLSEAGSRVELDGEAIDPVDADFAGLRRGRR